MTKLLEEAIAQVRRMPAGTQDIAAGVLTRYLDATRAAKLSDAQLNEVRRRRAERNPSTLSLGQFDDRLRRFGV